MFRRRKKGKVIWQEAKDVKKRIRIIIDQVELPWIRKEKVFCYRSTNSSSRAFARIWSLPRIWQQALNIQPSYIIEVLSEKFDKLNDKEKQKVLIHELAHIPRNFSGSLLPHIRRGKRNFRDRVEDLFGQYLRNKIYRN